MDDGKICFNHHHLNGIERERGTTDIDLMRAKRSEVIPTVGVGLELEQGLVVRVVGGMLPKRGAW